MASLMREVGISQLAWRACDAFRMRVSMSAIGSLMLMGLPARLRHAGDLAGERQTTKADTAQREASDERARPTTQATPVVCLDFVARRSLRLRNHGFLCQMWPPV